MKYAEGVEKEDKDIKEKREAARDSINLCQDKINELMQITPDDENLQFNEIIE